MVAALQPVFAAYAAGDKTGAVDAFLRLVCGDHYRRALDAVLPARVDEAVGEADLFFQAEMAAVQQWRFGAGEAEQVTRPVLNVLGAESARSGSSKAVSWSSPGSRTPNGCGYQRPGTC